MLLYLRLDTEVPFPVTDSPRLDLPFPYYSELLPVVGKNYRNWKFSVASLVSQKECDELLHFLRTFPSHENMEFKVNYTLNWGTPVTETCTKKLYLETQLVQIQKELESLC